MKDNPFRKLPSVTLVLQAAPLAGLETEYPRDQLVAAINAELDDLRKRLVQGEETDGQLTAATVIVLRAVCAAKEVIVSRGQLIEIGGSFRIPDIMTVSGATLREVGTTNITRLADYEKAIGANTGALMQIHSSNYRISGFTK